MQHVKVFLIPTAIALSIFSSCAPTYPGGLSEAEWNSLSPDRKAELNLRQQQLDATRLSNVESEMLRAEQRREHDQQHLEKELQNSIHLSKKDQQLINSLGN